MNGWSYNEKKYTPPQKKKKKKEKEKKNEKEIWPLERSTYFLYIVCVQKKDRLEQFLSWIHFGITRTVQHQSSPVWNFSF